MTNIAGVTRFPGCVMPSCLRSSPRPDASTVKCLRLLYLLTDRKTTRFFQALGEEVDVDSEVY